MIIKLGETKPQQLRQSSISGVILNVYIKADVANTALVAADFLPQELMLKVNLSRNKANKTVCQDNLKILGLYSALNYGINSWYRGNVLTYPAVGIKEEKLISVMVMFGQAINVKNDDELTIECTAGRGIFSAAVDQGVSYVEFNPMFARGYEWGTPKINAKVVQQNITNEKYSFGDNVVKLAFLNFDQDSLANQVITSINVMSDQYRASLNFYDLLNIHWNHNVYPTVQYRFGNTQPVTAGNEAFPYLPKYPQSVVIAVGDENNNLDNCQVDASFNSANVNASQNYFVGTTLDMTAETVTKAEIRSVKHQQEKAIQLT